MDYNIKTKINNSEFFEAIYKFVILIMISAFFGYCGYMFCLDNDYNLRKGIVFGALLPIILYYIDERFELGFIKFILIIIIWIFVCRYMPLLLGIITLSLALTYGIYTIYDAYRNRTVTEVITINNNNNNEIKPLKHKINIDYDMKKSNDIYTKNYINEDFEESDYYCERCDKKISEEEYEENAGLCEDCDAEVYFGERYDGDDYDMWR